MRKDGLLHSDKKGEFEISECQVRDIDNEVDWRFAELKYQILNEQG
jgi:CMP-N-acetylneuraminic acid synthetase